MSEPRFRGICIGGPHDGRMVESVIPYYRAIAIPDYRAMAEPSSISCVNYVFEVLRCPPTRDRPGGEFGLWRREDQSMPEMLRQLIDGYQPQQKES